MTNLQDIITLALSGGLASALVGLFTIRSKIRKSRAETESLNLENSEKATGILMANIVEPLQHELNETRKEMVLLRDAIRDASTCRYAHDCPVLLRLRIKRENQQNGRKSKENGTAVDDLHAVSTLGRSPPATACGAVENAS